MPYILIIDDDPNSAKLLSTNLEKRGHHTLAVPRFTSTVLEEMPKNPDLILVSINLPSRHAEADVEQLRSLPDMALIPILVLSTDPPDRQWMARWGVESCLLKPFDIRQLLVWLQPWLDNDGGTDAKRSSALKVKQSLRGKEEEG